MNFFLLIVLVQITFLGLSASQKSTTSKGTQDLKSASNKILPLMSSWNTKLKARITRKPAVRIRTGPRNIPTVSDTILSSGESNDLSSPLSSKSGTVKLQFEGVGNLVVVRQCDNEIIWTQTIRRKRSLPDASQQIQTHMATGFQEEPDTPESKSNPEQSVESSSEDIPETIRTLVMKENGNLIISGLNGETFWESQSRTDEQHEADLRLQDDGYLCVFSSATGGCIWSNNKRSSVTCNKSTNTRGRNRSSTTRRTTRRSVEPTGPVAGRARSVLDDGEIILPSRRSLMFGEATLWSGNTSVGLDIQEHDERPVLRVFRRCDEEVLWSAKLWETDRSGPAHLIMQSDGDLILYNTVDHQQYWASNTHENGAVLKLYNNGLLCVYKGGRCLWSTERVFTNVNCRS